jgi:hypothetical protein
MQSLLLFIAEVQAAKRRLLNNFEVSGDGRSSREPKGDAQDCDTLKPTNARKYTMYESRETTSPGVLSDTLRCNQNRIGSFEYSSYPATLISEASRTSEG